MRELTQTFRFREATKDRLAEILATAPLVGENSIFGNRRVGSTSTEAGIRQAIGFEPAPIPLLRFDVKLQQQVTDDLITVILDFEQPGRVRPYLAGQFVWLLSDEPGPTAVLREEINTPAALSIVEQPLHGSPMSFRRWLFFAGGHQRLMKDATDNLEHLLKADTDQIP